MTNAEKMTASGDVHDLGHMRSSGKLSFIIFAVFFVFYIGAAVLQTPAFKSWASLPCLGMPLGLLLSLAIFPVSWALIVIYFVKAR